MAKGRATKFTKTCAGCDDPLVRRNDLRRCTPCDRLFCRFCIDDKSDICIECGGPRPADRDKYMNQYSRAHDERLAKARQVV